MTRPDKDELTEELAALEHRQWVHWSKAVADDIDNDDRLDRWEDRWVDYDDLPDDVQDSDREWANKVLELLEDHDVLDLGPIHDHYRVVDDQRAEGGRDHMDREQEQEEEDDG